MIKKELTQKLFNATQDASGVPTISPEELLSQLKAAKIIDVRRPDEFVGELGHIDGAVLATLETDLTPYLEKLSKDENYVFVCRSGGRSGVACQLAASVGFQNIFNMQGGMIAWNEKRFPIAK